MVSAMLAAVMLVVGVAASSPVRVAPVEFARDPVALIDRFLPRNENGLSWRT